MHKALLVDDDELVRGTVRKMLAQLGFAVDEALEGGDALEKLSNERFDLLLTDIFMPGVEGLELIRTARRRNPSITILAMSGGGRELWDVESSYVARAASAFGAIGLIAKPFTLAELRDVLAKP